MTMFRANLLRLCQKCYKRLAYNTGYSTRTLSIGRDLLQISEEVSEALHSGNPVVALETTIITHGMPYPDNLRMATEVETLIRNKRSTPATIGILQGKLHIGLNKSELEYLADPSTKSVKTSRRDFPYVMSQKLNGGTTVSGTMVAAHMAGIQVFVTGGIGGVHRGAENSMDISADLTELSRTPVAVVSAGVKSILDIGRTLEYLETEGVCVASYGDSTDFPAFFTRQSGFHAPYNVTTPEQAARLIDSTLELGLQTGLLFAVPIPSQYEAEGKIIEEAIQTAILESKVAGITGKDVTPFILQRLNELTAGKSLEANIHLVKNNASVGSDIAIALSWLRKNHDGNLQATKNPEKPRNVISKQGKRKKSGAKDVVVIGGSIVDFYARLKQSSDLQLNGGTYTGTVQQLLGGVGRNVADCLSRLGVSPLFISAIGNDSHKAAFQAHCSHMDLSGVAVLDDVSTATYFAILRDSGELMFGVGDMDIHSRITPEYISQFEEEISTAKLVFVDGNLTVQAIDHVCQMSHQHNVPVWSDPADVYKASKPFQSTLSQPVTYTSPNLNELRAIASYLNKQSSYNTGNPDDLDKSSVIEESIHLLKVVAEMVPVVIVTLGRHGAILCCHGDKGEKFQFPVRGQPLKLFADVT